MIRGVNGGKNRGNKVGMDIMGIYMGLEVSSSDRKHEIFV
jgi:hypothetical protein